ncbi:E3 ubiquitin-protein ligase [Forsythia ovata]|uniref:RING-type E3 ubiquitin transferase n=1 Tax=Forsythia ovata TaxID=205694 RepID=A0ABD1WC66_9LAMI
MANVSDLPCDADGVCMVCKKSVDGETLTCKTCATPWHSTCLSVPLKTLADAAQWECPDCSLTADPPGGATVKSSISGGDLVEKIRAIESDLSLTDREKAKRRQELLSGDAKSASPDPIQEQKSNGGTNEVLAILGDKLNCSICMQLLDRPVSTPCGHNFCLKCFQKWVGQGKRTCAICREMIPSKMAREPRINSAIVMAIRNAKMSQSNVSGDRPNKAYTTERAKKSGKANACSGKIFVTVPLDHFGPITAEHDPERNLGVLVGETWEDRMECRQWGAHFTHVAGIAGQSEYGAQSVALSGGYEDDEDHGEWFLYTGSGGRDLSGNKRTNKKQSFDQKFDKSNEALRVSCKNGYPLRVVRSHKEKRSSYAPQEGVRYDGIYRIEKCWRKAGIQGFKVCRYLFVRCDNDPAPWTSDTHGDRPRELPIVEELKHATDITERKKSPAWDYDEEQCCWIWKRPPPESRKAPDVYDEEGKITKRARRQKRNESVKERLLKEFSCLICRKVMVLPLTTPCAHNFCKACLENAFAGQSFIKQRTCGGTRTLRTQKNVMKCPSCTNDVSDFLQNPQVNRELMNLIESLQSQMKEENMETEELDDGADEEDAELCDETDDACVQVDMGEEIDGTDGKSNIGAENKNCDQPSIGKEAQDRHDAVSDNLDAGVARGEVPKGRYKRQSAGEETCSLAPKGGKKRRSNKT